VRMLTTGNDSETLTSASEIIATFDGTDTVYGGGGNDKFIGGKDVDTLYGQAGNDHLYGFSGNDILDGGDGNDKIVGGLGDDTISGGAGDDYVLAQTGDDAISTGAGTDEVLGGSGDDVITVDGSGNKTIDGGAGTDSIAINLSGHTSLTDFGISYANETFTFTDKSNNTISLKNLESYSIGSNSYVQWSDAAINSGDGGASNSFWGTTEKLLYGYSGGVFYGQKLTNNSSPFTGMSTSDDLKYVGDDGQQTLNLNVSRSSYTGDFDISLNGGNDSILSAKFTNNDSLDAGSGDDTVYIMVGGGNGTPAFTSLNMAKLDGGSGTDTLAFEESTTGGAEINLTRGGAVNFENLIGTSGAETVRGDSGNNVLSGKGGADTIFGGTGNDTLYADSINNGASSANTNDTLYGEAGNDVLVASAGDNTLDGGTGADTITTGGGSDKIILRIGDGGSELSDADIITDFTDGSDDFGLTTGLSFSDLTRAQGSGDYANDTIISYGSEYLAILQGIDVSLLSEADFEPVDFA